MIRMLAFDLDGTLLDEQSRLTGRTRDALLRCREAGVVLTVATGRGSTAASLVPLDLFDGYATTNGARAWANGRLVYEQTIPASLAAPLLRQISAMGFRVAAEIDDVHWANYDVRARWPSVPAQCQTDFAELPGEAEKLYALVEDTGQAERIRALLPGALHMHVARDGLAMIMRREATKARAVEAMARAFGIPMADVAAFGDDVNDLDMLVACGVSVAMGNAVPEVRGAASHICESNHRDGVARWLEAYLL